MLAGFGGLEDAGVYRLDDERALVHTVDFFPPIVDDPRWFGRIAAANAMSDVFAMGGRVLSALNVVGWPEGLDLEILAEILAGGADKLREVGAALCGGHSVMDSEIKYGMAVTGEVHPERFWRNRDARAGDLLLLTKPLGMGAVSTAIKKRKASEAMTRAAMELMATLNAAAARAALEEPVHAATDVTGFGLLGHACEMAEGAGLTLRLRASAVPLFEGALQLARDGITSGQAARGRRNLGERVSIRDGVDDALSAILFDAETSGGLLLAVPEERAEALARRLVDAGSPAGAVVGSFEPRGDHVVVVEP